MEARDTYKYELYDGNELVYVGITNNLERRKGEHKTEGMTFTSMQQVGYITTRQNAGDWEAARIQTYMQNHGGRRPRYNDNDSGK